MHLANHAIPANPMALFTDGNGDVVKRALPVMLSSSDLEDLKKISRTNDPRVVSDPESGLVFWPFGRATEGGPKKIAGIVLHDADKYLSGIIQFDFLRETARSVMQNTHPPSFRVDW